MKWILKSVFIIAIFFVFFVPISAQAEMFVETDKSNYGITDLIRITGYIENFETFYDRYEISDPITLAIYQDELLVFSDSFTYWKTQDDIRYVIDGYFSTFIVPKSQLPTDWSGQYTVITTYQDQSASTTFSFVGTNTFGGLTSISNTGILQINDYEYKINEETNIVEVIGLFPLYPDRTLVFELSDGNSIIDTQEFNYVSPIFEIPDKISDKLSDRTGSFMNPIYTQFELDDSLSSGIYYIEMYMPNIPDTPEQASNCKYLRVCSGHNNYDRIPKIEFFVTNVFENLGIASFVDQTKDPQHYIDRYNNEPSYKEWFDENYPQYFSIYDAVGLEKLNEEVLPNCENGDKNGLCIVSDEFRQKCMGLVDTITSYETDLSISLNQFNIAVTEYYDSNCKSTEKLWYVEPDTSFIGLKKSDDSPKLTEDPNIVCGTGTIENAQGQCVAEEKSSGGGCLIATATYGSELAPQVQQLRELRDNQLLQTESGAAFMGTFNDIYYSFSPIIADYERENPYFKEAVKLAITPMISSLSLMENAESESEVLGIGISVIAC